MKGHIPASIRAGATFDHTLGLNQYLAPAWSVSLVLRGPSAIDITSQPIDTRHQLLVDAATTATWLPGEYVFSLRAISSGTIMEVESGQIPVLPDVTTIAAGADTRTHAQIALANIEAVLEKRASQDQQRYTINNRELWRTPLGDLLKLRDYYRAEVARMKASQRGRLFARQLKATF